jgi:hypothetical protein
VSSLDLLSQLDEDRSQLLAVAAPWSIELDEEIRKLG